MDRDAITAKRKEDSRKYFTRIWGIAKDRFITAQQNSGISWPAAQINWEKTRAHLRTQKIQKPPQWLEEGKTSENQKRLEDVVRNEDNTKKQKLTPLNKTVTEEEFAEQLKQEQRLARLKKAQELSKAWKAGLQPRTAQATPDKTTPSQGPASSTPKKVSKKRQITEADYDDRDGAGPSNRPDTPEPPSKLQVVDLAAPSPNMSSSGTDDQNMDGVDDSTGGNQGSVHANRTFDAQSGGGGLAGAGNNAYFHRFAGSTRPRDPKEYSYVDTYKRPFQIHTEFPKVGLKDDPLVTTPGIVEDTTFATIGPEITIDAQYAADKGFPYRYHEMKWNHNGIMVPYWFQEASMLNCDWNKPDDHLAYQVEEFGFTIPNLRLNILNNDRAEVTEVAPAPPSDARLWMFVDTNNDYGLPGRYPTSACTHNQYFQLEDFDSTDLATYSLPLVHTRGTLITPGEAAMILSNRGWKRPGGPGQPYENTDPNAAYNIKRHPNYHEFILSEANIGFSYKNNAPVIRFPHIENTNCNITHRQKATGPDAMQAEGPTQVHTWESLTAPFTAAYSESTGTKAMCQYYCESLGPRSKLIGTGSTWSEDDHNKLWNKLTDAPVMPPGQITIAEGFDRFLTRTTGRANTSDDGTVWASTPTNRPPLVMFGIFKELEYRQSGALFWRYFAYGQVEYFVKIRWFVNPSRFPTHWNIGLGACLTDKVEGDLTRQRWLKERMKRRQTARPIAKATDYENINDKEAFY